MHADWENEKTETGIYTGKKQMFIIGTLPIVFTLAGNKKEISELKAKHPVKLGGDLKQVLNSKGEDPKYQEYKKAIWEITLRLEKVLSDIMQKGEFLKKQVKEIAIVNIKK